MCKVIEDFKISLIENGKSAKTIESYIGDIKAFIEFLGSKGVEFSGTLQRFYVVSYKNFLVESNYEVATINKKINSIHALNRYLVATGEYIIYAKDCYFYLYEGGVLIKEEETMIQVMLRDILQEPKFGVWTIKREKEYMEALKRTVYYNGEMNPIKNYINLKNCLFNTDDFTVRNHSADFLSSIQIPVEYDGSAKCPRFLEFLKVCFQNNEERIIVAQEWLGYLLTSETKAQKALILYGGGGNGKGVFTEVLTWLIGEENISNIPLNELNKGFSRVCIYNKTANISNENETEGKGFNTQYFKSIVGEDTINAEQKNKPVFSFKPTAKIVMSMNNLPYTNDKSYGYYRRLSILQFSAYISEEKRDKQLKDKLKEELSGIFNWAIEGL